MFRLLKFLFLLKLLNPFRRGFTLLRLLGLAAVGLGLISYYGMPGWLSDMISQATGKQVQTAGRGGTGQSSSDILAGVLGESEKAVGGILDSVLHREPGKQSESGGILTDLLNFGGGKTTQPPSSSSSPSGYGPPPEFTGGTVTASADLFAAYAGHGLNANQLRMLPDSPMPPTRKPDNKQWQSISSIIDGDTIVVGRDKVRLIGVDAPEVQANEHLRNELNRIGAQNREASMLFMGREAAGFLKRLAEGRRCWLEYDEGGRDQYGRILAYIHLEDGTNLNEAMIYQGYAKAYLGANFRYVKRYIYLQDEAMRRGNGFWSAVR